LARFSSRELVDALLEASVVGSFTRIGYGARRRLFSWTPLAALPLAGKTFVVTGGTSGIGRAAAGAMAAGGARVCIVGRDPERTERARAELAAGPGEIEAELADLSLVEETQALAGRILARHDRVDALVLNAGALLHEYTLTAEGNEVTLATHVLTPFLLAREIPAGRVVFVASGGMYTQRLDVAALEPARHGYDGTKAYARCKRAQVALAGEFARRQTTRSVNAMHPGWADTPALRDALPAFSRTLGPLLRTPAEGADTIVWLSAAPEAAGFRGQFFLDRRARAKHRLGRTRRPDEAEEEARLWKFLSARLGGAT
jgi:NAD(P)-dependent dehydrogenase (short-subunit alcohol dehydrogenase family)